MILGSAPLGTLRSVLGAIYSRASAGAVDVVTATSLQVVNLAASGVTVNAVADTGLSVSGFSSTGLQVTGVESV